MEYLIYYIFTGLLTGLVAGLLGVGGGLIVVPSLLLIFTQQGFDSATIMQMILGTSLATIVITSMISSYAHHRHQAVQWRVVLRLTPMIILGTVSGAFLAAEMETRSLKIIFGLFEIGVALQMWLGLRPKGEAEDIGIGVYSVIGGGIGLISALVGIGGGTLTVPFLLWFKTNLRCAIATSAAVGIPIAIAGSVGYLLAGWSIETLEGPNLGFIYLPAFIAIVIGTILTAPLGAKLTHRLPLAVLKRTFALFLLLVGVRILWI